ncbi:MAG: PDZ domain-containing protein [Acidobacteriota bacterium]
MKIIKNYHTLRPVFYVLTAIALVLAVIGIRDLSSSPYLGYEASADFKVTKVNANSPAALAGLRVGDEIVAIRGTPTERLHELSRQRRAAIGEETTLSILRENIRHELVLRPTALPPGRAWLSWAGNVMALVMMFLGVVIYRRRPGKSSALYFMSNLCFALAFLTPPYFESFALRTLISVNFLLFLTMGLAFFLHLTVVFPRPKPLIAETGIVELLIYLPAPLMAVCYLGLRWLHPGADLLINVVLRDVFALMVASCLLLALAAVAHSFWKGGPGEKFPILGMLLLGSLVGILPPTADFLSETFLLRTTLPGDQYYFLFAILVPMVFAYGLTKVSRAQPPTVMHDVA